MLMRMVMFVTVVWLGSVIPVFGQNDSGKISTIALDVLDLKNMDINDVLKLISQKSGLNVAASKNVNGRVSVFLKDIDVYDALRIICETNGWAFTKESSVIQVMLAQEYELKYGKAFGQDESTEVVALKHTQSKDVVNIVSQMKSQTGKVIADDRSNSLILMDRPEKVKEMAAIIRQIDTPMETQVIELIHAKAADVATQLQEFVTPTLGKVKADERSNKLIIIDSPKKITELRAIAEQLDHRDPEVLIEAKIIQIALDDEHKTGVDWQGIVRKSHDLTFTGKFDLLSSTDKRGEISIGTLATDDYTGLIHALETIGRTNILSSPRIAALNNKEAKILIGSTEPYVTTTTTTNTSGPPTVSETVNFIDVGVKLYVTPRIHKDGFITMEIKPEVSSVVDTITTSTNNTIPVVETSEAETTVMVKDGVTIVIGGLMKDTNSEETKRIPWLGRIPVLGYPFRSHVNSVESNELAILLTPRIMTGDVDTSSRYLSEEQKPRQP